MDHCDGDLNFNYRVRTKAKMIRKEVRFVMGMVCFDEDLKVKEVKVELSEG